MTDSPYQAFAREFVGDTDSWILVSPYSLGDTYSIASLGKAFKEARGGDRPVRLVVRKSAEPLARMFARDFDCITAIPDVLLIGKREELLRTGYPSLPAPGHAYFVHPNFAPRVRVDVFNTVEVTTQLGMYAVLLGLRPDTRPEAPEITAEARHQAETLLEHKRIRRGRTAVLFPHANSWPTPAPDLWTMIADKLREAGWDVYETGADIPLDCVLPFVEACGWVIGSLCGLMNVFCSSGIECRKTILTQAIWPDLPDGFRHPLPISATYPYAYQRRFDGKRYDVEEILVTDHAEYASIASAVTANARLSPAKGPVTQVSVDMAPGDLLDRIAILKVKRTKFQGEKRAYVEKELRVLSETAAPLIRDFPGLSAKLDQLVTVNDEAWTVNDLMYAALDVRSLETVDHLKQSTILNSRRIKLKNAVNALCNSAWREQKSYDLA